MPNIVLTNLCNLHCSYCFSEATRSKNIQVLSIENLETILQFLRQSDIHELGLIGGEPTLHPQFKQIAIKLANENQFRKIFVYTNGICLSNYFPQLLRPDICYLLNVNSPTEIGEIKFSAIVETLEIAQRYKMLGQISLGVNLYKEKQDFEYVLSLCSRYRFTGLRLSIAIPRQAANVDKKKYFLRLKPTLMRLYHRMKELDIVPKYDCNIVPSCFFTEEEKAFLRSMPGSASDISKILGNNAVCHPVIDIYPDLSVTRCFGMSYLHNKSILDFQTLNDLCRYCVFHLDGKLLYSDKTHVCHNCSQRQILRCYGGCLAFLSKGISAHV